MRRCVLEGWGSSGFNRYTSRKQLPACKHAIAFLIVQISLSHFYSMTQEGKLSVEERLKVIKTIGRLPDAQFEQLVCALNMPLENKPGGSAAKGDKASNLIGWAESSVGPGLVELQ